MKRILKKGMMFIAMLAIFSVANTQNAFGQTQALKGFTDNLEDTTKKVSNFKIINGGDAKTFEYSFEYGNKEPRCVMIEYSDDAHDDWLILPKVAIVDGSKLIFWYKGNEPSVPEKFDVKLSKTTNEVAAFDTTLNKDVTTTGVYQKYEYDLSAYKGKDVYLGIHTTTKDKYQLVLDDFEVTYPYDNDLTVSKIEGISEFIQPNIDITPKVVISNVGKQQVVSYSVTLEGTKSGAATSFYNETVSVTDTLAAKGTKEVEFPTWRTDEGDYTFKAIVNLASDENKNNDTLIIDGIKVKQTNFVYTHIVTQNAAFSEGVGRFDLLTPSKLDKIRDIKSNDPIVYGSACANGVWYGAAMYNTFDGTKHHFCKIDFETGEQTIIDALPALLTSMTYDYDTEQMFGIESDSVLVKIDIHTGKIDSVGYLAKKIHAFACNLEGKLFGIDTGGDLFAINKENATLEKIASTGQTKLESLQGASFDHNTGKLYWVAWSEFTRGTLFEVNTSDATLTKIDTIQSLAKISDIVFNFSLKKYAIQFAVKSGNDAVEGAIIKIKGRTITTDNLGVGNIDLPKGTYHYIVVKDGFANYSGTFEVLDKNVSVDVALVAGDAEWEVSFEAKDEDGKPINAVNVVLEEKSNTTNTQGRVIILSKNGTDIPYSLKKEGYNDVTGKVTVNSKDTLIKITMTEDPQSKFVLSVSEHNFEKIKLDSVSNFEIIANNKSKNPLSISKVEIKGENAAEFKTSLKKDTTIKANGELKFEVIFGPKTKGNKVAILEITASSSTEPYQINLSGEGISGTGIKAKESESISVKIYPSVVEDGFVVELKDSHLNSGLEISNLAGKKVYVKKLISNKEYINISHLPSGFYIVSVNKNTVKIFKK